MYQSIFWARSTISGTVDVSNSFKKQVAVAEVIHSRACIFASMKMVGFPYPHMNYFILIPPLPPYNYCNYIPPYATISPLEFLFPETLYQRCDWSKCPDTFPIIRPATYIYQCSYCTPSIQSFSVVSQVIRRQ